LEGGLKDARSERQLASKTLEIRLYSSERVQPFDG
jgi:hypothetical protein